MALSLQSYRKKKKKVFLMNYSANAFLTHLEHILGLLNITPLLRMDKERLDLKPSGGAHRYISRESSVSGFLICWQ